MTENDLSTYGHDIAAFLRAKDGIKRAKKEKKEADANFEKAKAGLKDLQANFLAAFEDSEDSKNSAADKWIADTTTKSIWSMIMIEFDYKSAFRRRKTRIGAEKSPEHGSGRPLNMSCTPYKSTMNINIILISTF